MDIFLHHLGLVFLVGRNLRILFLFLLVVLVNSCGHITEIRDSYVHDKDSNVFEINGAKVSSEILPTKDTSSVGLSAMVYFYGIAKTVGPYKLVIKANGEKGHHKFMNINSLSYKFDGEDTVKVSKGLLFKNLPFWSNGEKDSTNFAQAKYKTPFKFTDNDSKKKNLKIITDISVISEDRTERKKLTFNFIPQVTKNKEFVSFPKEIIKKFKKEE